MLATYVLEVGARVSLKVATKGSLRGKKNSEKLDFTVAFPKEKRRSETKKCKLSLLNLPGSCLVQIRIFWKWVHTFPWKWQPKGILQVKKLSKFRFLGCFSKAKTGLYYQKIRIFSAKSWGLSPSSNTYFLEVSANVSLKIATKVYFKGKKTLKTLCDQWNWRFSDQFGITIPRSDTYFLEVVAGFSLKVATKVSLLMEKKPVKS